MANSSSLFKETNNNKIAIDWNKIINHYRNHHNYLMEIMIICRAIDLSLNLLCNRINLEITQKIIAII